jgi:hypothetical protein
MRLDKLLFQASIYGLAVGSFALPVARPAYADQVLEFSKEELEKQIALLKTSLQGSLDSLSKKSTELVEKFKASDTRQDLQKLFAKVDEKFEAVKAKREDAAQRADEELKVLRKNAKESLTRENLEKIKADLETRKSAIAATLGTEAKWNAFVKQLERLGLKADEFFKSSYDSLRDEYRRTEEKARQVEDALKE